MFILMYGRENDTEVLESAVHLDSFRDLLSIREKNAITDERIREL